MSATPSLTLDARTGPIAARANVYALFSRLFLYPGDDRELHRLQQNYAATLREISSLLPYAVPSLSDASLNDADASDEDRAAGFTRLFDNCTGRAQISLNEKDHVTTDSQKLWEELIRFYEHFGLRYELGSAHAWPDALVVELEFMHYLAFLEADATSGDDANDIVRAQADFLARHLAAWVPLLAGQVAQKGSGTIYPALASALADFITADTQYLTHRRIAAQAA